MSYIALKWAKHTTPSLLQMTYTIQSDTWQVKGTSDIIIIGSISSQAYTHVSFTIHQMSSRTLYILPDILIQASTVTRWHCQRARYVALHSGMRYDMAPYPGLHVHFPRMRLILWRHTYMGKITRVRDAPFPTATKTKNRVAFICWPPGDYQTNTNLKI